jgi:chemotaxis protein MotB
MVDYDNRDQEGEANVVNESGSIDALYQMIVDYIKDNGLEDRVSVIKMADTILVRFNEVALFNSGEADILPQGEETIRRIAEIISSNMALIEAVRVEGHTDNVPMHSAEFEDNWDLSTRRATNTLRLILATGLISSEDIYAAGYADTKPISSNDTAEDRAKNRRVDIILQELQDG